MRKEFPEKTTFGWHIQPVGDAARLDVLINELSLAPIVIRHGKKPPSVYEQEMTELFSQLMQLQGDKEFAISPYTSNISIRRGSNLLVIGMETPSQQRRADYAYEQQRNSINYSALFNWPKIPDPILYEKDQVGYWRAHTVLNLASRAISTYSGTTVS